MGLIALVVGIMIGLGLNRFFRSAFPRNLRSDAGPSTENFATKDELQKLREEVEHVKKSHSTDQDGSSVALEEFYNEEFE